MIKFKLYERAPRARALAFGLVFIALGLPHSTHAERSDIHAFVPAVAGLSAEAPLPLKPTPELLPDALLKIARERVAQEQRSPAWFKRLLNTKVGSYFRVNARPAAPGEARAKLLGDVIKVFNEFEAQDTSGEFSTFVSDQLAPFVASLEPKEIENPIRHGVATEPIARWSLQTLVIKQMLTHLGRYKDFSKRALNLVVGKHLKGASYVAATTITYAVLYRYFPAQTWSTSLAIANFAGVLFAGPINAVTTAAAGFFVRPTTEVVKTLGARLTSELEAKINRGYDKLVARYFSGGDPESNDSVRIATFDEEHTDFAGMSAEDQLKNWARGLNLFIMVQNIFGRLLRDTHHGGRDLMMLSWTDSQNISQLVELLDTKEHVLRGLQFAILAPYRNALVHNGDYTAKNELDARVKSFDHLTAEVWLNPDADQVQVDALATKIEAAAHSLREYGLNDGELRDLMEIQRQRGRAIGKLITAAAVGHLRQFYGAERNRNLARDAHHIAHAIQVGFGTEEYTERYLPLVRRQMRLMGMEFSEADPLSPLDDPAVIRREHCLIKALRHELELPAGASAATYACVNALVGVDPQNALKSDPNSATARVLSALKSQGARLEAGGIMKYAATMLGDPTKLQRQVGAALAKCN